jgi:protocatechuate 3,4-dioxygenase beta subunit
MKTITRSLIIITTGTPAAISQHNLNGNAVEVGDADTCANQECSASRSASEKSVHLKTSKHCPSSPDQIIISKSSLLQPFYNSGQTAQAYKPNAPTKNRVCEAKSNSVNKVARNFLWRSNRPEAIPISIRGNIYTCSHNNLSTRNLVVEVWQPRPDGTYSSLREGVQEGDCRAVLPLIDTDPSESPNNFLGRLEIETLSPGSPGLFGGIVPSAAAMLFHDIPPFGPGVIHFMINADGQYPLLAQISMSEISHMVSISKGLFFGQDLRPHARSSGNDLFGGVEVQSASLENSTLEIEVDFFLAPMPSYMVVHQEDTAAMLYRKDIFCSSDSGISSFFKEPISVCVPSLLDYFEL